MSYELHRPGHSQAWVAASGILPRGAVQLVGTDSPFVVPVGSTNVEPFGIIGAGTAGASGLSAGETVTVYEDTNVVKAVAAASLGPGADVGCATFGRLGPVTHASGAVEWVVGKAQEPAAAGETFACLVKIRRFGGGA